MGKILYILIMPIRHAGFDYTQNAILQYDHTIMIILVRRCSGPVHRTTLLSHSQRNASAARRERRGQLHSRRLNVIS